MKEGGGIATALAGMLLLFLLALPFLLVVVLYTFFTVYAMTKGTTFGGGTVNHGVLFAGIAVITAGLVASISGLGALMGRSLAPKRGRDAIDEAPPV